MKGEIKALFIFEILGRPPEHIKQALEGFIENLNNQKGIHIIRKEIHEPKLLEKENAKDLFTTFAEVELTADNINLIFDLTFNMLPSHVEILEPREIELKNFDLTSAVSNLAVKIHRYDEIAKISVMEKNILINKLKEAEEKIKNLENKKNTGKKKKK